jgi:hypothetical protein
VLETGIGCAFVAGFEREILGAPDVVARAAARLAREPEQKWMLNQPLEVRRSYIKKVLDPDGDQVAWMLRQSDDVRGSYAREVLGRDADPAHRWMLGQPPEVRLSYVADIIEAGGDQRIWMLRQPDAVRESFIADVLSR